MMRRVVGSTLRQSNQSFRGVRLARQFHGGLPNLQSNEELEKAPLGPSFIEKYSLNEPSRFVPLTVAGFGMASATGLYHFDPESQLLALWVLFCGTIYSRGGPIIAASLDEMKEAIQKEQNELEDKEIDGVKATIAAHKMQEEVFEDLTQLFEAQKGIQAELATTAENQLKHQVRDAVVSRLNSMAALEQKYADELRSEVVAKATDSVRATYSSDSSLKSSALANAIAALGNPEKAKKDTTVGDLYSKYLKGFSSKVASAQGKEVELSAADKAAIKETLGTILRREGVDESLATVPAKAVL